MRFPEFDREWESSTLRKITSYVDYRGRAPKKSEKGHFLVTAKNIKKGYINYISSKEFVEENDYANVMSKGLPSIGDILFTTEAPLGNVAQVDIENIALAQRVIKFRGNKNIENKYLLYYMLSDIFQKTIKKKAIGTTVQGISSKELHKILVFYPKLKEQIKISNFISIVDKRIKIQGKIIDNLETLIKGLEQKIFSKQLKFKDKNGKNFPEWETKKLGDILDYQQPTKYIVRSTEYDNSYLTPVLTAGKSFILGYSNEIENIFSNIPVIIFDDFTMAIQFVGFPFKVKSSAMKILKNNFKNSDIRFVYTAMKMINYPKGDEHKRFWISEYSKIKIPFPCLEEQNKTSNFLSNISKKIDSEKKILEEYKNQKKFLLQNIFI